MRNSVENECVLFSIFILDGFVLFIYNSTNQSKQMMKEVISNKRSVDKFVFHSYKIEYFKLSKQAFLIRENAKPTRERVAHFWSSLHLWHQISQVLGRISKIWLVTYKARVQAVFMQKISSQTFKLREPFW